jgi:hypothetical protein
MSAVEDIHRELDYDHWEPELKKISGVWSSLQKQRKQTGDAAGLKKYRLYLERCIGNLKTHDARLSDDEITRLSGEWRDYHGKRLTALGDKPLSRLPQGVDDWMAKWSPRVYQDYALALSAVMDKSTKRTFDRLMETTQAMFDGFEGAV